MYSTFFHILVGHGYSEGDRGHIDSIESYITDVVSHLHDTRNEYSSLPLFLMGHSMVSDTVVNRWMD